MTDGPQDGSGESTTGGGGMCRVFLVDDHAVFRSGVRAELAGQSTIEVVGEAGSVAEAVTGIDRVRPDVVLLDVHMPDGGGVAVLRSVLGADPGGVADPARAPEPTFLALSVSDAAEDVIAVIRAGARGYVTKTITGEDLADAVCRVADGDAVFSPRLAGFVLTRSRAPPRAPPIVASPSTTPRSTRSPRVRRRCCGCWPAATPTRRSPRSCSSRSRRWRPTPPTSSARPSSPTGTR